MPRQLSLNEQQEEALQQVLEIAIGEGQEALAQHEAELPTDTDFISAAEEYSNLIAVQQQRLTCLEQIMQMLDDKE